MRDATQSVADAAGGVENLPSGSAGVNTEFTPIGVSTGPTTDGDLLRKGLEQHRSELRNGLPTCSGQSRRQVKVRRMNKAIGETPAQARSGGKFRISSNCSEIGCHSML